MYSGKDWQGELEVPRRLDVRSICEVETPIRKASWIHPYPAKMLGEIAGSIVLSLRGHSKGESSPLLVDPMCGSGTTLLFGLCAGWSVRGFDANPLATLISKVKITHYDQRSLAESIRKLQTAILNLGKTDLVDLKESDEFGALDYWFWPSIIDEVARFRVSLEQISIPEKDRNFLLLAASSSIRPVSKADPEVVPPTISIKRKQSFGVGRPLSFLTTFRTRAERIKSALTSPTIRNLKRGYSGVKCLDARELDLEDGRADYVLMSPPYFTAHDYVRSVRLELLSLGMCSVEELHRLHKNTIGSVGTYGVCVSAFGLPKCDSIISKLGLRDERRGVMLWRYLQDMKEVLTECQRILKHNGSLVMVIGDSTSQGLKIPTAKLMIELCTSIGMRLRSVPVVNAIRSRGFMTRRNTTAAVIEDEWILHFTPYN